MAMLDVWKEFSRFKIIEEQDFLRDNGYNKDPEKLKNALNLYNQAINDIQLKSDDIAAIGLKKAISIYPEFLDAKVLLSLCYILRGQVEQAQEQLKEVIASDDAIAHAYRYLQQITQTKDGVKNKGFKERINTTRISKVSNTKSKRAVYLKGIAILIAGILISSFFYINSLTQIRKSEHEQVSRLEKTIQDNEESIAEYELKLEEANREMDRMRQYLDEKAVTDEYLENVKILLEIDQLVDNNEKEKAAGLLIALKDFPFQDFENEKYETLYEKVIPSVASETYYKGYNLYQARRYDEAVVAFEKLFEYDIKNNQYQYALYYAGRCYQFAGDKDRAINYYNQIINLFPNGEYVWHAKNRIQELQQRE